VLAEQGPRLTPDKRTIGQARGRDSVSPQEANPGQGDQKCSSGNDHGESLTCPDHPSIRRVGSRSSSPARCQILQGHCDYQSRNDGDERDARCRKNDGEQSPSDSSVQKDGFGVTRTDTREPDYRHEENRHEDRAKDPLIGGAAGE
jgi:hypothetical protein